MFENRPKNPPPTASPKKEVLRGDPPSPKRGTPPEKFVYLNGDFLALEEARISPEDRGFLLGDGLFETIRSYNGRLFRWPQHRARLESGLEELRIPASEIPERIPHIFDELRVRNKIAEAVMRITISRGAGGTGYSWNPAAPRTVYATLRRPPDIPQRRKRGMTLETSSIPRPLPFTSVVKTISLGAMALARLEAYADEALLLDAGGFVAEGTASAVFFLFGQEFIRPEAAVLKSITAEVIEELRPVRVHRLSLEEARCADAIFLASTGMGPIGVREWDGRSYPHRHPLITALQADFDRLVAVETGAGN